MMFGLNNEERTAETEELEKQLADNFEDKPNLFVETIRLILIALAIVLPIRIFIVAPFIVDGTSMEPNYHNGEYLLVDEISYRLQPPQRGDVVVFHPPDAADVYYIKRIVGLPGETIQITDGQIVISNHANPQGIFLNESGYLIGASASASEFTKVTLKENEYFVIGDNRDNSRDSRRIGPVSKDHFKGKAMLRVFPFNKFLIVQRPDYINADAVNK
jgi:signal peptidase I